MRLAFLFSSFCLSKKKGVLSALPLCSYALYALANGILSMPKTEASAVFTARVCVHLKYLISIFGMCMMNFLS